MDIIPVIDICGGDVVHARKGQRSLYQPVQSKICSSSDPVNIVQAFLKIYPFNTIYIADLDAIGGKDINSQVINKLNDHFPDVCFWVDDGLANEREVSDKHMPGHRMIIGSETGIGPEYLETLINKQFNPVLSLDFKDEKFIGNTTLFSDPSSWPEDIIIMNLSRVGSDKGPDLELLNAVINKNKNKKFYLGGGIRNTADLRLLKNTEITGVLIATALHNNEISRDDIYEIVNKQP